MHPRRHAGHQRLRPAGLPARLHARPRRAACASCWTAAPWRRSAACRAGRRRGRARPTAGHRVVRGHAAGAERRGDPRRAGRDALQPLRLPAARRARRRAPRPGPAAGRLRGTLALFTEASCAPCRCRRAGRGAARLRQPGRGPARGAGGPAQRPGGVRADRPAPAAPGRGDDGGGRSSPPRPRPYCWSSTRPIAPPRRAGSALELVDRCIDATGSALLA